MANSGTVTGLWHLLCGTCNVFNCSGWCKSGTLGIGFQRCVVATRRAFCCCIRNNQADSDVKFSVQVSSDHLSTRVWNLPKYMVSPSVNEQ